MERKRIYSFQQEIQSMHVDIDQRLRLDQLFGFIQEGANQHADNLGFGYKDLKNKKQFWVLSRAIIEIKRYPKWHETIEVSTWHRGFAKLFGMRDFELKDKDSNICAIATTAWLVLDADTHRPLRINPGPDELNEQVNKSVFDYIPGSLSQPKNENTISNVFTAQYSNIDLNGHVNNTQYITWLCDCLDKEWHSKYSIKKIQVNFNSEMKWGEKIEIKKGFENNIALFAGISIEGNKNIFQSKIEF